ncbi:hypothetical protein Ais01nite_31300 [Asanoa ishikariensis]|uniref:Copper(I)-binding protein n=1 Tax=Asanoa ishikariensis TaxID=137265 RepID=A0A1H3UUW8_9ACTN|nr:hypothetical protein [Asanoa ishikariensis]GIF65095.1 hypothetical protein Ais01nite_31300 [Asanoa ishikariensis]SDZ66213.1 hypothetical protein SAMN05421684_8129 [Asanoa ishikariensis]
MTRSKFGTRRRAVLLAGLAVAASASLLLTGCGSGQTSSTADTVPAIDGIDADLNAANGGTYSVRNMTVDFKVEGYPTGSDARLALALYNNTNSPVTVRVSSPAAESVRLVNPSATPSPVVQPAATATPSAGATGTPTPTAPAAPPAPAQVGGPAEITIPPAGFVQLNQQKGSYLLLTGLTGDLNDGNSVPVVFDFNGQQLTANAGLAVPLSPLPRGPKVVPDEGHEADVAPFES